MRSFLPLFALGGVYGWWDGGHYISGLIAKQNLIERGRPDVVEKIEKILESDPKNFPIHDDWVMAPIWMDDIKLSTSSNVYPIADFVRTWDNNHFMNIPLWDAHHCDGDPTRCATRENAQTYFDDETLNHIDVLLANAFGHLAPFGGTRHEMNGYMWATHLHLRFIMHLIGDGHMPFHTSSIWYSGWWPCPAEYSPRPEAPCVRPDGMSDEEVEEKYPYGGIYAHQNCRGGNFLRINYDDDVPSEVRASTNNLHGFWDSMGGYINGYVNQVPEEERQRLTDIVLEEYPYTVLREHYRVDNNWTLQDDVYWNAFTVAAIGDPYDGCISEDGSCPEGKESSTAFEGITAADNTCMAIHYVNYCTAERAFTITKAYQEFSMRASKRLVALSGYRMADALIRIADQFPQRLMDRIEELRTTTAAPPTTEESSTSGVDLEVTTEPSVDSDSEVTTGPPGVVTTGPPGVVTTGPPGVVTTGPPAVVTTGPPGTTVPSTVSPPSDSVSDSESASESTSDGDAESAARVMGLTGVLTLPLLFAGAH